MDIYFQVAFKPVATIMQTQTTLNKQGEMVEMQGRKGRHDPHAVPRAVPIVEAMAALSFSRFCLFLDRSLRHFKRFYPYFSCSLIEGNAHEKTSLPLENL